MKPSSRLRSARRTLRVAACQILTYPDVAKSARKIIDWLRRAAADRIEVVAFPEASLCGYPDGASFWETARPDAFARAEKRIARACGELGVAAVVGTVRWHEGRRLNSLVVIDRDGSVAGYYDKVFLAEKWPDPGRRVPLFTIAGVPACCIICHDIRFPELVRLPTIAGAKVCYFSSNEAGMVKEYKFSAYRSMPIARATENGIYLIMANAPGDLDNIRSISQSHGNSKIVHPDGNVIDEASHFEERLVTATLDLSAADRGPAREIAEEDSPLRDWIQEGVALVDETPGAKKRKSKS